MFVLTFAIACIIFTSTPASAEDGYELWMRYRPVDDALKLREYRNATTHIVVEGKSATHKAIREELDTALDALLGKDIPIPEEQIGNGALIVGTPADSKLIASAGLEGQLSALGPDGFLLKSTKINNKPCTIIAANHPVGAMYGSFHLLRLIQTRQNISSLNIAEKPRIKLRMLNHWDNLNGFIERGYAGKSLWKWDELPGKIDPRYKDYARANASLGLNATAINNVNANADILTAAYLKKVAALADIFRPYGIRVYLSANFSAPVKIGGLKTADPLDKEVQAWWNAKVDEIYALIPDFGGFLVKANSEGQPGPQDYGRTHAEGAKLLSEPLAKHGGTLLWRAFVYGGQNVQSEPDRAKQAYLEFKPFDGKFDDNVFVQVKNGPLDFQPREPFSPLFGAMPKTPLCAELQITQEYLGFSNHLVYLAPMWKEFLDSDTCAKGKDSQVYKVVDGSLYKRPISAIAGVANTGSDRNWCGHHFAQSNWYAFGRLAWDHRLSSEQIADEWIKMTFTHDPQAVKIIRKMMMGSREACVNYETPLGIQILCAGNHYDPDPALRASFHRADKLGLGYDRTKETGSSGVSQYNPPLDEIFNNPNTCPEEYLLWFHHIPWDYTLKNGRTLWDELCHKYYSGHKYVVDMQSAWNSLSGKIDAERFSHVKNRLTLHESHAKQWRDTCVDYFKDFSEKPVRPGSHPEGRTSMQTSNYDSSMLKKVLDAKRDIWGEAAIRRPNGASYDFFARLLPPLRYVNAQFRHYPIVLSAPKAPNKVRLVSNGSAINAKCKLETWREIGVPVSFYVGNGEPFGQDIQKLDGPRYVQGYLPLVEVAYQHEGSIYQQETFAGAEEPLASNGTAFVQFRLKEGKAGRLSARVDAKAEYRTADRVIVDGDGRVLVWFSREWKWEESEKALIAELKPGSTTALAVFTQPLSSLPTGSLTNSFYDNQREICMRTWQSLIDRCMQVETPETVVNNAWKALVIGTYMLLKDDALCYSAQNQYECLFQAECGDAVRGLLLFGLQSDVRRMLIPMLDFKQPGLDFHDASFKLQLLSHYYWLTHDQEFLKAQSERYKSPIKTLLSNINPSTGLLPKERYCGDESQLVDSLNINANAWKGLRDISVIMDEIGDTKEAHDVANTAQTFRKTILEAVDKSISHDTEPPFVPIALFGQEKPYEAITASRSGSYWNLLIPYILGSGVLGDDSKQTDWILRYIQQHGGLCMGIIRFHQHSGLFANENGVDDLYTLRYVTALLRRDDPERALVSFYGKLAQGLTQDTFIGGEGSSLVPLDDYGRPTYLPPCSSGNALTLWNLRYMLVQDLDIDDDGKPETLRLMFATPKSWLEDGKSVKIKEAPTAFGPVSATMTSHLKNGEVIAQIEAPERMPKTMLLRCRVPDGWKVQSATIGNQTLAVDSRGTVDITGRTGKFTVRFKVSGSREEDQNQQIKHES